MKLIIEFFYRVMAIIREFFTRMRFGKPQAQREMIPVVAELIEVPNISECPPTLAKQEVTIGRDDFLECPRSKENLRKFDEFIRRREASDQAFQELREVYYDWLQITQRSQRVLEALIDYIAPVGKNPAVLVRKRKATVGHQYSVLRKCIGGYFHFLMNDRKEYHEMFDLMKNEFHAESFTPDPVPETGAEWEVYNTLRELKEQQNSKQTRESFWNAVIAFIGMATFLQVCFPKGWVLAIALAVIVVGVGIGLLVVGTVFLILWVSLNWSTIPHRLREFWDSIRFPRWLRRRGEVSYWTPRGFLAEVNRRDRNNFKLNEFVQLRQRIPFESQKGKDFALPVVVLHKRYYLTPSTFAKNLPYISEEGQRMWWGVVKNMGYARFRDFMHLVQTNSYSWSLTQCRDFPRSAVGRVAPHQLIPLNQCFGIQNYANPIRRELDRRKARDEKYASVFEAEQCPGEFRAEGFIDFTLFHTPEEFTTLCSTINNMIASFDITPRMQKILRALCILSFQLLQKDFSQRAAAVAAFMNGLDIEGAWVVGLSAALAKFSEGSPREFKAENGGVDVDLFTGLSHMFLTVFQAKSASDVYIEKIVKERLVNVRESIKSLEFLWNYVMESLSYVQDLLRAQAAGLGLDEYRATQAIPRALEWMQKTTELLSNDLGVKQTCVSREWADKIRDLKKEGDKILIETAKAPVGHASLAIRTLYHRIAELYTKYVNMGAGHVHRVPPWVLYLWGLTEMGKSTAMIVLVPDVFQRMKEKTCKKCHGSDRTCDHDSDYDFAKEFDFGRDVYSRNPAQEFWDGYQEQDVVIWDEFGQLRDEEKNAECIVELMQLCNTAPYNLNMADLDSKGNTRFTSKFMVLTANTDFNDRITGGCQHAAAARRRRDLVVEVTPAKEFERVVTTDESTPDGSRFRQLNFDAVKKEAAKWRYPSGDKVTFLREAYDFVIWESGGIRRGARTGEVLKWWDLVEKICDSWIEKRKWGHDMLKECKLGRPYRMFEDIPHLMPNDPLAPSEGDTSTVPGVCVDECCDEMHAESWVEDARKLPLNIAKRSFSWIRDYVNKVFPSLPESEEEGRHRFLTRAKAWVWSWYPTPLQKVEGENQHLISYAWHELQVAKQQAEKLITRNTLVKMAGVCVAATGVLWLLFRKGGSADDTSERFGVGFDSESEIKNPKGRPARREHRRFNLPKAEIGLKEVQAVSAGVDEQSTNVIAYCMYPQLMVLTIRRDRTIVGYMHGLMVKGTYLMTCAHFFYQANKRALDQYEIIVDEGYTNVEVYRTTMDELLKVCEFDRDRDLVVMRLPPSKVHLYRDITKHFVDDTALSAHFDECTVVTTLNDRPVCVTGGELTFRGEMDVRWADDIPGKLGTYKVIGAFLYKARSFKGMCGSPVLTYPRAKILGIHTAANDQCPAGIIVSRARISQLLNKLENKLHLKIPDMYVEDDSLEVPSPEECEKSGFTSEFGLMPVGKVRKDRGHHVALRKSEIIPTIIQGEVRAPCTKPVSEYKFLDENGKRRNVAMEAISKTAGPIIELDPVAMGKALLSVRNHILTVDSSNTQRRDLTEFEVLNGVQDHPYIQPMPINTSAGYPWGCEATLKGKKSFIVGEPGKRELIEEVRASVAERLAKARQGIIVPTIFADNLKDERKKEGKLPRVFQSSPLDLFVAMKMKFGAFVGAMSGKFAKSDLCIGINPLGDDWKHLFKRLDGIKGKWIAGDYKNFDGFAVHEVYYHFLNIIDEWYSLHTEESLDSKMERRGVYLACFNGMRLCGTTLYRFHRGLPSGIFLTLLLNCMMNMFLIRYMFEFLRLVHADTDSSPHHEQCKSLSMYDFDKLVRLSVCGDDIVAKVSEAIPWFNMHVLAAAFEFHGITFTDPGKHESVREWMELEEVTFLKRRFVVDLPYIFAPIEVDTIYEIINWTRRKDDPEEALLDNIKCAKVEAFHHGEEFYENFCKAVDLACLRKRIPVTVISYHEMIEKWLDGTYLQWISHCSAE